jgi:hypothetical protein
LPTTTCQARSIVVLSCSSSSLELVARANILRARLSPCISRVTWPHSCGPLVIIVCPCCTVVLNTPNLLCQSSSSILIGQLSDQVTPPSTVQRRSAHANWCAHASATPTPSTARPPAHASKIMPLVPRTPTHATTSRQPNYTMQLMITDPRLLDQAKGPRLLELTLRPTLHAPRQKTKTQPAAPHVNASNF